MIAVTITRDELVRHGACAEGLDLFERIAPSGRLEIAEWTPLHTLWLAVDEPSHCGWLVGHGIVPRAYLRGANLTGAYVGIGASAPEGWRTTASGHLAREVGA